MFSTLSTAVVEQSGENVKWSPLGGENVCFFFPLLNKVND